MRPVARNKLRGNNLNVYKRFHCTFKDVGEISLKYVSVTTHEDIEIGEGLTLRNMFHFGFGGSTKNSIVSTLFYFIVDFLLGLVDYLTLCAAVVNPLASRAHEVGQSSTGGTLAVTWIHFGFGKFIFLNKKIFILKS